VHGADERVRDVIPPDTSLTLSSPNITLRAPCTLLTPQGLGACMVLEGGRGRGLGFGVEGFGFMVQRVECRVVSRRAGRCLFRVES